MPRFQRQVPLRAALIAASLVATGLVAAGLVATSLGLQMVATAALAQTPNINLMPELKSQSPEERERDAKADKAYRESLRRIPDKTVNDPWGDVRGTEAARAAKSSVPKSDAPKATQAKRQTRTDGAAN